jgi:hypothetical protein
MKTGAGPRAAADQLSHAGKHAGGIGGMCAHRGDTFVHERVASLHQQKSLQL